MTRVLLRLLGSTNPEIQARHRAVSAHATDYRRWTDANNYNPQWASRSHVSVEMLDDAKWICDIGCGSQDLRRILPSDAIYLPMDLKQWTDETILCDINRKSLPVDYIQLADLTFVMGVLEYLFEPVWFLTELFRYTEGIVISYNVAELCTARREDNGWVNDFTAAQFETLVESAGFKIVDRRTHADREVILKAVNPNYGPGVKRLVQRSRFLDPYSEVATAL